MKPFRFLLFTLLAALASCSDGIEDVAPAITSYTGLALAVPQVTVSSASKTMNATPKECTANDLYLFCYPQGKGTRYSQELISWAGEKDLNNDAAVYKIILQPGTYHVYVVANMGDKSIGTNTDGTQKLFKDNYRSLTEEQLKALTLTYDALTLPTAGNIPMVYASDKEVVVYDGKATEVAANLTFTCAKVVVNIIFDPDNEAIRTQQQNAADVFKNGINWLLTSVKGNNLTTSTNLFTAAPNGSLFDVTLPDGKFYDRDHYTFTEGNKDKTNQDVVTSIGEGSTSPTNARSWLYQATYYLPERSVTKEADATALPVTGKIIGKGGEYSNTYNNISGDKLSTKSTENSTDYYKLERGHYYEIVSFVNGLGQYDLPTKVEVKDWTPVQISADFLHTTLQVDKTAASIGSLTKDSVEYTTNAIGNISTGCKTEVGGSPVVSIADKTYGGKRYLVFSINPAISMKTFEDNNATTGTAKVWILAGNIKKYIDVSYNVTPFLTVTPVKEVIYWNDADDKERKKVLTFKTNLGGIKFKTEDFTASFDSNKGGSHTFGQSTITVECDGSNQVAEGTITVTADTDPVTTTEHTFTVYPYPYKDNDDYKKLAKEVLVTVKPVAGDYRIYMRAINDLQLMKSEDNGGRVFSQEYMENWRRDENNTPSLTDNGNWVDGWTYKSTNPANYEDQTTNDWSNNANADNHYAYIYTQIGETETASEKDKIPAWLFTAKWPGDEMTADANNPGWYYINEKKEKESTDNIASTGTKIIKPGETLIIFNNRTNTIKGYTLHRFTHHLDPGIPLFNFEDHEGWYLYDPLCDPYYRVFDDKPKVEDITYVIYTKVPVKGWYHIYGVATNVTSNTLTDPKTQSFSIYSKNTNSTRQSNGWYMMTLKFKCAQGYYEKAIKLRGVTGDPVLFYKMPLKPTNGTITGYFDGSEWHEGTPTGAAKRRR